MEVLWLVLSSERLHHSLATARTTVLEMEPTLVTTLEVPTIAARILTPRIVGRLLRPRTGKKSRLRTLASHRTWWAASLGVAAAKLVRSGRARVLASQLRRLHTTRQENVCLLSWGVPERTRRPSIFSTRTSKPRRCVGANNLKTNHPPFHAVLFMDQYLRSAASHSSSSKPKQMNLRLDKPYTCPIHN